MAMGAPGAIAGLPGTPGVYRFRDARGGVLYIGRATALRNRVASYWSDLRERGHLAPMVAGVARIEAVTCDSPHEAALLERNLLEASLPPWNRTPGGQENLVYIRMDKEPRAPGLTVDHLRRPAANVQYFGPYLGGLRVRQAIAALHRILPLCYTGTGLRGAQLDIARARGFAGADRAELISTLTAVLQRQPDVLAWARAELEQLRHRAAGALAYEVADRIQAEIEALDWVTSPQRVTTMMPVTSTYAGGPAACWCASASATGGFANGRSATAANPAPRRSWPPHRLVGGASRSATLNSPPPWWNAQRDLRCPPPPAS